MASSPSPYSQEVWGSAVNPALTPLLSSHASQVTIDHHNSNSHTSANNATAAPLSHPSGGDPSASPVSTDMYPFDLETAAAEAQPPRHPGASPSATPSVATYVISNSVPPLLRSALSSQPQAYMPMSLVQQQPSSPALQPAPQQQQQQQYSTRRVSVLDEAALSASPSDSRTRQVGTATWKAGPTTAAAAAGTTDTTRGSSATRPASSHGGASATTTLHDVAGCASAGSYTSVESSRRRQQQATHPAAAAAKLHHAGNCSAIDGHPFPSFENLDCVSPQLLSPYLNTSLPNTANGSGVFYLPPHRHTSARCSGTDAVDLQESSGFSGVALVPGQRATPNGYISESSSQFALPRSSAKPQRTNAVHHNNASSSSSSSGGGGGGGAATPVPRCGLQSPSLVIGTLTAATVADPHTQRETTSSDSPLHHGLQSPLRLSPASASAAATSAPPPLPPQSSTTASAEAVAHTSQQQQQQQGGCIEKLAAVPQRPPRPLSLSGYSDSNSNNSNPQRAESNFGVGRDADVNNVLCTFQPRSATVPLHTAPASSSSDKARSINDADPTGTGGSTRKRLDGLPSSSPHNSKSVLSTSGTSTTNAATPTEPSNMSTSTKPPPSRRQLRRRDLPPLNTASARTPTASNTESVDTDTAAVVPLTGFVASNRGTGNTPTPVKLSLPTVLPAGRHRYDIGLSDGLQLSGLASNSGMSYHPSRSVSGSGSNNAAISKSESFGEHCRMSSAVRLNLRSFHPTSPTKQQQQQQLRPMRPPALTEPSLRMNGSTHLSTSRVTSSTLINDADSATCSTTATMTGTAPSPMARRSSAKPGETPATNAHTTRRFVLRRAAPRVAGSAAPHSAAQEAGASVDANNIPQPDGKAASSPSLSQQQQQQQSESSLSQTGQSDSAPASVSATMTAPPQPSTGVPSHSRRRFTRQQQQQRPTAAAPSPPRKPRTTDADGASPVELMLTSHSPTMPPLRTTAKDGAASTSMGTPTSARSSTSPTSARSGTKAPATKRRLKTKALVRSEQPQRHLYGSPLNASTTSSFSSAMPQRQTPALSSVASLSLSISQPSQATIAARAHPARSLTSASMMFSVSSLVPCTPAAGGAAAGAGVGARLSPVQQLVTPRPRETSLQVSASSLLLHAVTASPIVVFMNGNGLDDGATRVTAAAGTAGTTSMRASRPRFLPQFSRQMRTTRRPTASVETPSHRGGGTHRAEDQQDSVKLPLQTKAGAAGHGRPPRSLPPAISSSSPPPSALSSATVMNSSPSVPLQMQSNSTLRGHSVTRGVGDDEEDEKERVEAPSVPVLETLAVDASNGHSSGGGKEREKRKEEAAAAAAAAALDQSAPLRDVSTSMEEVTCLRPVRAKVDAELPSSPHEAMPTTENDVKGEATATALIASSSRTNPAAPGTSANRSLTPTIVCPAIATPPSREPYTLQQADVAALHGAPLAATADTTEKEKGSVLSASPPVVTPLVVPVVVVGVAKEEEPAAETTEPAATTATCTEARHHNTIAEPVRDDSQSHSDDDDDDADAGTPPHSTSTKTTETKDSPTPQARPADQPINNPSPLPAPSKSPLRRRHRSTHDEDNDSFLCPAVPSINVEKLVAGSIEASAAAVLSVEKHHTPLPEPHTSQQLAPTAVQREREADKGGDDQGNALGNASPLALSEIAEGKAATTADAAAVVVPVPCPEVVAEHQKEEAAIRAAFCTASASNAAARSHGAKDAVEAPVMHASPTQPHGLIAASCNTTAAMSTALVRTDLTAASADSVEKQQQQQRPPHPPNPATTTMTNVAAVTKTPTATVCYHRSALYSFFASGRSAGRGSASHHSTPESIAAAAATTTGVVSSFYSSVDQQHHSARDGAAIAVTTTTAAAASHDVPYPRDPSSSEPVTASSSRGAATMRSSSPMTRLATLLFTYRATTPSDEAAAAPTAATTTPAAIPATRNDGSGSYRSLFHVARTPMLWPAAEKQQQQQMKTTTMPIGGPQPLAATTSASSVEDVVVGLRSMDKAPARCESLIVQRDFKPPLLQQQQQQHASPTTTAAASSSAPAQIPTLELSALMAVTKLALRTSSLATPLRPLAKRKWSSAVAQEAPAPVLPRRDSLFPPSCDVSGAGGQQTTTRTEADTVVPAITTDTSAVAVTERPTAKPLAEVDGSSPSATAAPAAAAVAATALAGTETTTAEPPLLPVMDQTGIGQLWMEVCASTPKNVEGPRYSLKPGDDATRTRRGVLNRQWLHHSRTSGEQSRNHHNCTPDRSRQRRSSRRSPLWSGHRSGTFAGNSNAAIAAAAMFGGVAQSDSGATRCSTSHTESSAPTSFSSGTAINNLSRDATHFSFPSIAAMMNSDDDEDDMYDERHARDNLMFLEYDPDIDEIMRAKAAVMRRTGRRPSASKLPLRRASAHFSGSDLLHLHNGEVPVAKPCLQPTSSFARRRRSSSGSAKYARHGSSSDGPSCEPRNVVDDNNNSDGAAARAAAMLRQHSGVVPSLRRALPSANASEEATQPDVSRRYLWHSPTLSLQSALLLSTDGSSESGESTCNENAGVGGSITADAARSVGSPDKEAQLAASPPHQPPPQSWQPHLHQRRHRVLPSFLLSDTDEDNNNGSASARSEYLRNEEVHEQAPTPTTPRADARGKMEGGAAAATGAPRVLRPSRQRRASVTQPEDGGVSPVLSLLAQWKNRPAPLVVEALRLPDSSVAAATTTTTTMQGSTTTAATTPTHANTAAPTPSTPKDNADPRLTPIPRSGDRNCLLPCFPLSTHGAGEDHEQQQSRGEEGAAAAGASGHVSHGALTHVLNTLSDSLTTVRSCTTTPPPRTVQREAVANISFAYHPLTLDELAGHAATLLESSAVSRSAFTIRSGLASALMSNADSHLDEGTTIVITATGEARAAAEEGDEQRTSCSTRDGQPNSPAVDEDNDNNSEGPPEVRTTQLRSERASVNEPPAAAADPRNNDDIHHRDSSNNRRRSNNVSGISVEGNDARPSARFSRDLPHIPPVIAPRDDNNSSDEEEEGENGDDDSSSTDLSTAQLQPWTSPFTFGVGLTATPHTAITGSVGGGAAAVPPPPPPPPTSSSGRVSPSAGPGILIPSRKWHSGSATTTPTPTPCVTLDDNAKGSGAANNDTDINPAAGGGAVVMDVQPFTLDGSASESTLAAGPAAADVGDRRRRAIRRTQTSFTALPDSDKPPGSPHPHPPLSSSASSSSPPHISSRPQLTSLATAVGLTQPSRRGSGPFVAAAALKDGGGDDVAAADTIPRAEDGVVVSAGHVQLPQPPPNRLHVSFCNELAGREAFAQSLTRTEGGSSSVSNGTAAAVTTTSLLSPRQVILAPSTQHGMVASVSPVTSPAGTSILVLPHTSPLVAPAANATAAAFASSTPSSPQPSSTAVEQGVTECSTAQPVCENSSLVTNLGGTQDREVRGEVQTVVPQRPPWAYLHTQQQQQQQGTPLPEATDLSQHHLHSHSNHHEHHHVHIQHAPNHAPSPLQCNRELVQGVATRCDSGRAGSGHNSSHHHCIGVSVAEPALSPAAAILHAHALVPTTTAATRVSMLQPSANERVASGSGDDGMKKDKSEEDSCLTQHHSPFTSRRNVAGTRAGSIPSARSGSLGRLRTYDWAGSMMGSVMTTESSSFLSSPTDSDV
jgi:hypothetical protein